MSDITVRDEEWKSLVDVFIAESLEMIEEVEPKLIELEKAAQSREGAAPILNFIFRLFHSLKGGAAALQLNVIRDLTHKAENLLELLREGKQAVRVEVIDLLCQTCDLVRQMLKEVSVRFDDGSFSAKAQELQVRLEQEARHPSSAPPAPGRAAPPSRTGPSPAGSPPVPLATPAAPTPPPVSPGSTGEPLPTPELAAEPAAEPPASDDRLAVSLAELKLDITPEMLARFAEEAEELFEEAEHALLDSEKDPQNLEATARAFRALHSFKGNAGFFGFHVLEEFSHAAETLLDRIREGKLPADRVAISAVLEALDRLRSTVTDLKLGRDPSAETFKQSLEHLRWLADPQKEAKGPRLGEVLVQHGLVTQEVIEEALNIQRQLATSGGEEEGEVRTEAEQKAVQRQAIRVDTDKLDRLLELVGELVISQANVAHSPDLEGIKADRLLKEIDRLTKITKDLQRMAMSVRMLPVSGLFRKMVRPVRDLSKSFAKQIELSFAGEDTEVDKNVIELLNDPLMHLIRNAVDHGVELPKDREKAGKSPAGRLRLEARHCGAEVWVIIGDDGRGLDRGRILARAREKGMVDGDGGNLSDEEVFRFIFEPGFSTAAKVTEVSGRGVGMDVVLKNVEKLKGRVEIQSEPGKGSTFTLRIPLTLSIIDGMVFRVGRERYIMPTDAIIEFFRPTTGAVLQLENLGEAVMLRDRLVTIFRMSTLFGVAGAETDPCRAHVMVMEANRHTIGLMVDEILGQQQTVIKNLGAAFQTVQGVSGAAVMPDGRVGLILDPGGLVNLVLGRK